MLSELFGLNPTVDVSDLVHFVLRMGLDLFMTVTVVQGMYMRRRGRAEYEFTYYLFNVVTFALCALLWKVRIEIGFALGLFGVFGILRYRAEQIGIRELTYLFVVIGLAIVNAIANGDVSLAQLVLVNVVIVGAVAILELRPQSSRTPVTYDKIELLLPGCETRLKEDLQTRLGKPIDRVEILKIDLLQETAHLEITNPITR